VPLQVGTRILVPTDPGGGGTNPDPDPGTGPGTNPGGGGSGGPTGGTTTPQLPLPGAPPGYGEGLVDQAVQGSGDAQPRGL
jgi:hypothetical protein